jgi:hypothetical protein
MDIDIIELGEIILNDRARDGTWCTMPYPNHPNGCPNFPQCPQYRSDFNEFNGYKWFAIIERFDLEAHAKRMKEKHHKWSERQCRNLLYWQNSVRAKLRKRTQIFAYQTNADIILEIPEANGVNIFGTMAKNGLLLKAHNPKIIYKIMFVGKKKKIELPKEVK